MWSVVWKPMFVLPTKWLVYPACPSFSESSVMPSGVQLEQMSACVPPMCTGKRPGRKLLRVGEQYLVRRVWRASEVQRSEHTSHASLSIQLPKSRRLHPIEVKHQRPRVAHGADQPRVRAARVKCHVALHALVMDAAAADAL